MASSYGNILKITIFGESHSKAIGLTIDGLPSGIKIDEEAIKMDLAKRNPNDGTSTERREPDEVIFLCGVFNGFTTGSPLTFIIENKDVDSSKYTKGEIRPSHADLTNYIKYNGYNDYRGGGFSSGRITASLVVLGTICKQILSNKGIKMGTHIHALHLLNDREFDFDNLEKDIDALNKAAFPALSKAKREEMIAEIKRAKRIRDSIGGMLETAIINVPIGLGEPYFDSLESSIAHLLFSIGGVKGVQFGDGWKFARLLGSEVKDEIKYTPEGKLEILANHNGGINGGISNGAPIIVQTVIKPTPSIPQKQQSVNLENKENIDLSISGRHDSCIVHRVRIVMEALIAYAIVDMLMLKESKNI